MADMSAEAIEAEEIIEDGKLNVWITSKIYCNNKSRG
ncbi:MAG: hypothetical protein KatS3mg087_1917 [Patescibacteria group bacterium]|nr:MAG: hypothetical protein KatS3mg087_1917 [Patescibacteria group bacterium]